MPPIGDQAGKSVNTPKRRVRVKQPSAKRVSRARAQEQQYASQGKAVKRVATTQRKAAIRKTQLAKSKPAAGDAPQNRAKDTQRAQAYVKKQYTTQAASDKARGIVRAPQVRVPYVKGTTVPPDVAAAVKSSRATATHKASVAGKLAPVLKVLDQTTRPVHAVAGAADAAVTGKNVLRAAQRGIENKDHTTFSTVLKHAGVKNKLVRGVAGFGLDVALDPTTYLTAGTGGLARKAATSAGEHAALRGVTVKVAGKQVPGITKATAKAGEVGGKVFRKTVPEKARNAARSVAADVNPNIAPVGVARETNRAAIQATRTARAKVNAGNRAAVDLAHGVRKQIGEKNYARVVDAIETGDTSTLPAALARHADTLRGHLSQIREVQRKAGVKVPERKGYVPRKLTKEAIEAKGKKPAVVGGRGTVAPGSSKARKELRPMSELRQAEPGKYRQDLHAIVAERMAEGTSSVARADLAQQLAKLGRDVKRGTHVNLADHEGLYSVKAGADLKEINPHSPKFAKPGKPDSKTRYVVLNREIVHRAQQGTAPSMGLSEKGIVRGFDKTTGVFKRLALATPGFHIRNAIGDTAQAYTQQSAPRLARNLVRAKGLTKTLSEQQKAARRLERPKPSGKTMHLPKYGKLSYEDIADNLVKAGAARSGYTAGELRELSRSGSKGIGKLRDVKSPVKVRNAFLNREDIPRLATAIRTLQEGGSWEQAAQKVADTHFDYQHLSSFERNIARRVLPFYTWSSRNIPFQAKTLIQRPGKAAAYQKLREEATAAVNPGQQDQQTRDLYKQLQQAGVKLPNGWERNLTEWEQRNAGVPVSIGGKKLTLSAGLPIADLNELPGAAGLGQAAEYGNKAASLVSPLIKDPVELWANYSFYFRDQVQRDTSPLTAAPGFVATWPKTMKDKLHVTKIIDKKSGKRVWAWPGRVDYVSKNMLPGLGNQAQQLLTQGADRRGRGTGEKIAGALGVKAVPIDPVHNAVNLAYARQHDIQIRLAALRQQGVGKAHPTAEWRRLNDQLKIVTRIAFQGKAAQGYKVMPKQGGPTKVRRSGGLVLGGGGGGKVVLGGGGSSRIVLGG